MAPALPWVIQSAQGWEKKWEREMGERRREGVRPSVRGLARSGRQRLLARASGRSSAFPRLPLSPSLSTICASESDPCAATVTPSLLAPTTWGERRAGEQRNAINGTQMLPSAADTDISSPTRHFVNPGITLYIISASDVLAPS